MALSKVNYVDNQTIITAQNLNNIQNEIIQNAELIKKAAPRNLLDNSDFRNPVNQRGQESYSGDFVFCVDRWCVSSDAAITDSGLTCSGGNFLLQRMQLKNLPIGRYTGAVCTADGTIVCGSIEFTASGSPEIIASENGIVIFLQKVTSDLGQFVLNSEDQKTWVWAALYEGEYTLDTLPEYQPKGYMVEALNCGALHVTTTATLDEGQWSNSAPFEQSIVIPGIIESDVPHITPVYSTTNTTAIAQKEAWACVSNAIAENGVIRFICFEDKPTTTIPIQIEVNR